jgi:hypothetical protein
VTAERAVAAVAGRRGGDPYGRRSRWPRGPARSRRWWAAATGWATPAFGRVNLATGAGGGGRPAGSALKTFALVAALSAGSRRRRCSRPGPAGGGPAGPGPGLAGGQLRRPRLRPDDPADGHRPVDQHRVRRAAAAPGRGRRRPRSAGGGRGGPADRGGQPAAAGAERRARHRRGDPAGDGLGLRHPGRQGAAGGPVRGAPGHRPRRPRPLPGPTRQRAGGAAGGGRDRRRRAARGGRPRHRRPRPDRPAGGGQDRHHPGPRRRLAGPAGSRTGRSKARSRRWSGCRWRGPRLAVGGRAVAAPAAAGGRRRRARPGVALRPRPGAQSPTASPVRLWVNPPHCPSPTPTTTSRPMPARPDRDARRSPRPWHRPLLGAVGGASSPHMDRGLQQLTRPLSSAGPCRAPYAPAGRRSG